MSYSKQFRGLAAAIVAAVVAFPATQLVEEEKAGVEPSTSEVHQKQLAIMVPEIADALSAFPQDAQLEVNLWGHGNVEDKGAFAWNVRVEDRAIPPEPVAG